MTLEKVDIKPELHPKLVFMQHLSDKYFDNLMSEYGLTNRREFFAGHEFNIQYSNDFIKCNTWTDCDNYSIQFIDLYRIDKTKNFRIDFWELSESVEIKNLYKESSDESGPLTKTFVDKYVNKEGEYEELNKPLKDYYDRKGAELFERNFKLHSELFRKHPEFFHKDYTFKQSETTQKKPKITVEINGKKDLNLSTDLTFREKIKKYFGI